MNHKQLCRRNFQSNSENWHSYGSSEYFYSEKNYCNQGRGPRNLRGSKGSFGLYHQYHPYEDYEWNEEELRYSSNENKGLNFDDRYDINEEASRSFSSSENVVSKKFFCNRQENRFSNAFPCKTRHFPNSNFYKGRRGCSRNKRLFRNSQEQFNVDSEKNKLKFKWRQAFAENEGHSRIKRTLLKRSASPKSNDRTLQKDPGASNKQCAKIKDESYLNEECDSAHILDSEHFITVDSVDDGSSGSLSYSSLLNNPEKQDINNDCTTDIDKVNRVAGNKDLKKVAERSPLEKPPVDVKEIENLQNELDELIASGNWDDDNDDVECDHSDADGRGDGGKALCAEVQDEKWEPIDMISQDELANAQCNIDKKEPANDKQESSWACYVNNTDLLTIPVLIGLEYLTVDKKYGSFLCNLCLGFPTKSLKACCEHLLGYSHKLNYAKRHLKKCKNILDKSCALSLRNLSLLCHYAVATSGYRRPIAVDNYIFRRLINKSLTQRFEALKNFGSQIFKPFWEEGSVVNHFYLEYFSPKKEDIEVLFKPCAAKAINQYMAEYKWKSAFEQLCQYVEHETIDSSPKMDEFFNYNKYYSDSDSTKLENNSKVGVDEPLDSLSAMKKKDQEAPRKKGKETFSSSRNSDAKNGLKNRNEAQPTASTSFSGGIQKLSNSSIRKKSTSLAPPKKGTQFDYKIKNKFEEALKKCVMKAKSPFESNTASMSDNSSRSKLPLGVKENFDPKFDDLNQKKLNPISKELKKIPDCESIASSPSDFYDTENAASCNESDSVESATTIIFNNDLNLQKCNTPATFEKQPCIKSAKKANIKQNLFENEKLGNKSQKYMTTKHNYNLSSVPNNITELASVPRTVENTAFDFVNNNAYGHKEHLPNSKKRSCYELDQLSKKFKKSEIKEKISPEALQNNKALNVKEKPALKHKGNEFKLPVDDSSGKLPRSNTLSGQSQEVGPKLFGQCKDKKYLNAAQVANVLPGQKKSIMPTSEFKSKPFHAKSEHENMYNILMKQLGTTSIPNAKKLQPPPIQQYLSKSSLCAKKKNVCDKNQNVDQTKIVHKAKTQHHGPPKEKGTRPSQFDAISVHNSFNRYKNQRRMNVSQDPRLNAGLVSKQKKKHAKPKVHSDVESSYPNGFIFKKILIPDCCHARYVYQKIISVIKRARRKRLSKIESSKYNNLPNIELPPQPTQNDKMKCIDALATAFLRAGIPSATKEQLDVIVNYFQRRENKPAEVSSTSPDSTVEIKGASNDCSNSQIVSPSACTKLDTLHGAGPSSSINNVKSSQATKSSSLKVLQETLSSFGLNCSQTTNSDGMPNIFLSLKK